MSCAAWNARLPIFRLRLLKLWCLLPEFSSVTLLCLDCVMKYSVGHYGVQLEGCACSKETLEKAQAAEAETHRRVESAQSRLQGAGTDAELARCAARYSELQQRASQLRQVQYLSPPIKLPTSHFCIQSLLQMMLAVP